MKKLVENLQHVQVPNDMCKTHELEPFDLLVYASIKRFMNRDTLEAFPSKETLKTLTQSGQDKINRSIDNLVKEGYLKVYYKGKQRVFVFSKKYKNFEPFSQAFLDKEDLSTTEKAYLIAAQQYMFKDLEGFGKISFSTKDLSLLINMPEWEIWKCDRSLQEKGYLNIINTRQRNKDTGLPLTERVYDMQALCQYIIWALSKNNKRVEENSARIKKLQKDLEMLRKALIKKNAQAKKKNQAEIDIDTLFLKLF